MKQGSEWYKREPLAYLGGVQGMTAKQHAVYSVVLDLLYLHGGEIDNDPKFISGYFKDLGQATVRKTIAELCEIIGSDDQPKLYIQDGKISQKRAKNQAKTKENLRETARKNGEKGGKKSAEIRAQLKENKDLAQPPASIESQAEKRREEKKVKEEAKASSKKQRGSRLSEKWELPREWGLWAISEGWSEPVVRLEADKFRDFWISQPGQKGVKLDWQATWRNWMRNSNSPKAINGGPHGQHPKPDTQLDAIARAARAGGPSG